MNVYVQEYRKIERRARRRDSFFVRYLPVLLILAGATVVGKIYIQSWAIEWSHRVMERKAAARDLALRNEELERSIAALTTRDRVTQEAGETLGMVAPREEDIVWLPVVDRTTRAPSEPVREDRGPLATVSVWFDALWQEEALALTSR